MKPQQQSIDEDMIKYKGRFFVGQYMPSKPVKRGLKVRSYWHVVSALSSLLLHAHSEFYNKICSCLTLIHCLLYFVFLQMLIWFLYIIISVYLFFSFFRYLCVVMKLAFVMTIGHIWEYITSFMEIHLEREESISICEEPWKIMVSMCSFTGLYRKNNIYV